MFIALAIAASIVMGPERVIPAPASDPVGTYREFEGQRLVDAAPLGRDFAIVWLSPSAMWWQRIDAVSGRPFQQTPSRLASLSDGGLPRIASSGDSAVVIWNDSGTLWSAGLGTDGASPPHAIGPAIQTKDPALTSFGTGYLIVASDGQAVLGRFLDSAGAPLGTGWFRIESGPYYPSGRAGLAVASNGSTALVIADGAVFSVSADGKVTTAHASFGLSGAETQIIWDGTAYVVTIRSSLDLLSVAAFDGNGRFVFQRSLSPGHIKDQSSRIVRTSFGSRVFINDTPPWTIELGPGGLPRELTARQLTLPAGVALMTAASNGNDYLIVTGHGQVFGYHQKYMGALSTPDVDTLPAPQPVALQRPPQSNPSVAVDDRTVFIGASENGGISVTRFDGFSFAHSRSFVPGAVSLSMASGGDRVAALAIGTDAQGLTIADDGTATTPVSIGSAIDDATGTMSYACGVVPVGNRYLGLWNRYGLGPPVSDDFGQLWTGSFSDASGQSTGDPGRNLDASALNDHAAAIVPNGETALVVYSDQYGVVRAVDVDGQGRMIGSATALNGGHMYPAQVALASDGHGRALAAWKSSSEVEAAIIDLASNKVLWSRPLSMRSAPQVAWSGTSFVIVSAELSFAELSRDGAQISCGFPGRRMPDGCAQYDAPFAGQVSQLSLAGGPAGVALAYVRPVPDLGDPTASRVIVRMLSVPGQGRNPAMPDP
jgi:hypothetical protein